MVEDILDVFKSVIPSWSSFTPLLGGIAAIGTCDRHFFACMCLSSYLWTLIVNCQSCMESVSAPSLEIFQSLVIKTMQIFLPRANLRHSTHVRICVQVSLEGRKSQSKADAVMSPMAEAQALKN